MPDTDRRTKILGLLEQVRPALTELQTLIEEPAGEGDESALNEELELINAELPESFTMNAPGATNAPAKPATVPITIRKPGK